MNESESIRAASFELDPIQCDVLVVGGGINGCGIARDLAGRGFKVVLCEQDDLAAH
ncbi:MAG: FAD-dependent oxidoreductase, partial [Gammaproteobacteria bacterium]